LEAIVELLIAFLKSRPACDAFLVVGAATVAFEFIRLIAAIPEPDRAKRLAEEIGETEAERARLEAHFRRVG
jgi:hypothetical protein